MAGFRDYLANQAGGIWKGLGEFVKHGAADAADTYQEILTSHSAITPPDGLAEPKPKPEPASNVRVSVSDSSTNIYTPQTHTTFTTHTTHNTHIHTPAKPSPDMPSPDIEP